MRSLVIISPLLLSTCLVTCSFIAPSFIGRRQKRSAKSSSFHSQNHQCSTRSFSSPSLASKAPANEESDDDDYSPQFNEGITKDVNGELLERGDSVRITQDLDEELKKGTIVSNIRLDNFLNGHDVEGNVDGLGVFALESKFLEKVPDGNDGITRDVENNEIKNGDSGILTRDFEGGLRMGTPVENITLGDHGHGLDLEAKIGPILCPLRSQHVFTGELLAEEELQEINDDGLTRDAHGQVLERGDTVYLTIDIDDELKKGTKVLNIRFDEYQHGHDVEGNIPGLGVFALESRTLVKVQGGNDGVVRDVEANEIKNGDKAILIKDFEGGLKTGTKVEDITVGDYGNGLDVAGRIGGVITCPLKSQYLYKVEGE